MLGSNCYIAHTERRKTQPRVFVISEVCGAILQANIRAQGRDRCLDICCQTLCQGNREEKNPKLCSQLSADFCAAVRSHNGCQSRRKKSYKFTFFVQVELIIKHSGYAPKLPLKRLGTRNAPLNCIESEANKVHQQTKG